MGGVPVYAIVLMLGGPTALGLGRILLTVARLCGWQRDPRPGFIDVRTRR